ncbi:hypothetical protein FJZ21_03205 [Candidatus Pacearchaeota archaeon]|nr:hypothetical protein [Candidatus Pacearchaeota archaeon]
MSISEAYKGDAIVFVINSNGFYIAHYSPDKEHALKRLEGYHFNKTDLVFIQKGVNFEGFEAIRELCKRSAKVEKRDLDGILSNS